MTVMERLVAAAHTDPTWRSRVACRVNNAVTCQDWGRKGGSHYKDGQFSKK
jgi:hypothetical protein